MDRWQPSRFQFLFYWSLLQFINSIILWCVLCMHWLPSNPFSTVRRNGWYIGNITWCTLQFCHLFFFVRSRMCVIDDPCTSEAFLVTFRGMNRSCTLKTVNSPPPTSLARSAIRFLFSFPQKSKMISSAVHQGVRLMTLDKRTTVSTFDQHGNHFISARYAQI